MTYKSHDEIRADIARMERELDDFVNALMWGACIGLPLGLLLLGVYAAVNS